MMTKTKKQTGVKSKNPVECGGKGNAVITLNPDDEFLFYQTQFENTVEFIMRRYRRKYADAFGMFAETNLFEDFEDEEEPGDFREGYLTMFHDWLIHTRGLVKSGFTGIDLYLERAKKLTLSEREMLGMMNDSVMTLFEVRVSRSRDKLVFNDLLLNYGRIEQPSPEMVDPLEKSVMGARVVHFSHGPALGIGYFPFMHDMKTLLLETLREYFADYKKAVPTATMETFLKNENPVVGLFL